MNNLVYYDYEQIPPVMVQNVYNSLSNPNLFPKKSNNYKAVRANQKLQEYVQDILPKKVIVCCQIIKSDLEIHKDIIRSIAYNYIIDPGGFSVKTCFYDDSYTVLDCHCIDTNRWHSLDVSINHNVINIERPRIAITCFDYDEVPDYYK